MSKQILERIVVCDESLSWEDEIKPFLMKIGITVLEHGIQRKYTFGCKKLVVVNHVSDHKYLIKQVRHFLKRIGTI